MKNHEEANYYIHNPAGKVFNQPLNRPSANVPGLRPSLQTDPIRSAALTKTPRLDLLYLPSLERILGLRIRGLNENWGDNERTLPWGITFDLEGAKFLVAYKLGLGKSVIQYSGYLGSQ